MGLTSIPVLWHANVYCVCFVRRAMAADFDVVNLLVIAAATLAVPIVAFGISFLLWPSVLIKVYHW